MKNITLIIFTITVMASASCRKTNCPAFPPHLVDYYPYHAGGILRFTNSENDTIAVKINNVETSGKESFAWNCGCSCGFSHSFITEGMDTTKFQIEGGISGSDNHIIMWSTLSDFYNYNNFLFF